eukprot:1165088-Ditylum_brightwellii.AAC.1
MTLCNVCICNQCYRNCDPSIRTYIEDEYRRDRDNDTTNAEEVSEDDKEDTEIDDYDSVPLFNSYYFDSDDSDDDNSTLPLYYNSDDDDDNFNDFSLNIPRNVDVDDNNEYTYTTVLDCDDFNNYVTSSFDPDIPDDESTEDFDTNLMATANAGEVAFEVETRTETKGMTISGH